MADAGGRAVGALNGVLYTVAGVTDLMLSHAHQVLTGVQCAVRRSDLCDVARDAHDDVMARGSLLVKRWTVPPDQHLEALARRVAVALAAEDDA